MWECGPVAKIEKVRWNEMGYQSRYQVVRSTQEGGSIRQERLLVVRVSNELASYWEWEPLPEITTVQERAMGNLLTPPGLVDRQEWRKTLPGHVTRPIDHRREAMPWAHESDRRGWIQDEKKGEPPAKYP